MTHFGASFMNNENSQKPIHKIEYQEQEEVRADIFLAKQLIYNLSRNKIKELINLGHITINNKKIKPSQILKTGDIIYLAIPENPELTVKPEDIPLDIYFEDEHMMIIDKPAGMIVHPTGKVHSGTLVNALLFHCKGQLSQMGGYERPGIVHRLDKETSGLMMVAKTEQAHRSLSKQIKERKVVKKYLTLVYGVVKDKEGYIEAPVGRDLKHGNKMAVTDVGGREARTYFKVVKYFASFTLLLIILYTGRTHQIRVHLQYLGYPVVGDKVYGLRKKRNPLIIIDRQALHSYFLKIQHPVSLQSLAFTSPLADDLLEQVKILQVS